MTYSLKDNSLLAGTLRKLREDDVLHGHWPAFRPAARSAGGPVSIPQCAQNGRAQKYQRWYGALIRLARRRRIDDPYTEIHHIVPRSMGGGDDGSNLVELTYREHFIAHWLLTKFSIGADLRKMQRALFAMTLQSNGTRIVAAWQFEVAKRAVKDLNISTRLMRAAEKAEAEAKKRQMEQHSAAWAAKRMELDRLSKTFLEEHKNVSTPQSRFDRRRKRRRPGKRIREAVKSGQSQIGARA